MPVVDMICTCLNAAVSAVVVVRAVGAAGLDWLDWLEQLFLRAQPVRLVQRCGGHNCWSGCDRADRFYWCERCYLWYRCNAIHLLEKNPEKIRWNKLSGNPKAIHMLEKNPEKIDWCFLSNNPNAIHILEKNPKKINWWYIPRNPSIFERVINFRYLKERMDIIREELIIKCMHPHRLERWLELGGDIDDF